MSERPASSVAAAALLADTRLRLGHVVLEPNRRLVQVLRPYDFVEAVFLALAGPSTRVSFEGQLGHLALTVPVDHGESGALRRQTIWPWQDFLVLALDMDAVPAVLDVLESDQSWPDHVVHLLI